MSGAHRLGAAGGSGEGLGYCGGGAIQVSTSFVLSYRVYRKVVFLNYMSGIGKQGPFTSLGMRMFRKVKDMRVGKYVMKLGGCEGILGDQISVKKFGNFVEFSALMYVLLVGVDYKRSNNQELLSMLRVHPLFSMDKEPFPDVSISLLPTTISNHWPRTC
ncbi:unnamed protein product [Prunus brigantina]